VRAPIQVQPGEVARLKVVVGNFFEYRIEVPMRQPMYDFVVTRYDGTEVWRWSRGQEIPDTPTVLTLDSREERELTADWDLLDDEGNPVPDGMYLVNGLLRLDPPCEAGWGRRLMFVGPLLSLDHLVDIRMEVPSEVRLGEAVPLKLQVENITSVPLTLYTGAMMYDFVVTDGNGEELWRWSGGRVFPMFGVNVVLQPGEVKEYEEMPWRQQAASYLSTNVPTSVWVEWEQCDQNCTPERMGIPCCGDRVPPGTYRAYGVLNARLSDGFEGYGEDTFESEPQEFTILP